MIPWRLWEESPWAAGGMSAAYLLTAILCLLNSQKQTGPFWPAMAALYFCLAVDRYLGLISRLCAFLRKRARVAGWYWSMRRPMQAALMLLFAIAVATACTLCARQVRSAAHALALAAAMYSVCLVILRGISMHEMDMILYRRRKILGGRRINLLVEAVGLLLMAFAVIEHFSNWT
jgi:hypothetical protein